MSDSSEEKTTCCCPCGMKIADFYHAGCADGDGVGVDGETGIFFNRLAPQPHFHKYHNMRPFRAWVQMVLPQVYDDALSYQELVYKLLAYINTMIANMDAFKHNISALEDAFARMECWINQWFKNLNIEGELEAVLDKMSLDGRLFDALNKYLAIGSGLQRSTTTKTKSTTETTTQTASDYPHCCCNCDCCDRCHYKEIKDGETVTITRDIDNVHVVITITRDGDEFTTTKVITWEYEESILYTWLVEGRGITISPESNPKNTEQTISVNIDDNSNWGVRVYDNDDGSIYFKLNYSVGSGMQIEDIGDGIAKFTVLIKEGTGINVDVDSKDNYYEISANINSDNNQGIDVVENDDGSLSYQLNLKEGDGIDVIDNSDGSTTIKALVKSGTGVKVALASDNYYQVSSNINNDGNSGIDVITNSDGSISYVVNIEGGGGIIVNFDETNNTYVISTIDDISLSDTLTIGSDVVVKLGGYIYPVYGSNSGAYLDYEHLTQVVEDDISYPTFKGSVVKDAYGNIKNIVVKVSNKSYICAGNLADTDIFQLKHGSEPTDVNCILLDFYFIDNYAYLSDPDYNVELTNPGAAIWNTCAVGGDSSVQLTQSNIDELKVFGASWNVNVTLNTYVSNGVRHFCLCAHQIADGYNSQYSVWGKYIYGSWLNVNTGTITLTM